MKKLGPRPVIDLEAALGEASVFGEPQPTIVQPEAKAIKEPSYDSDWERFEAWLGIQKKRLAESPKTPSGSRRRYLWISDLHVPFVNDRAVVEAIEHGIAAKTDTLIVGGDFLDCYSLSRFIQYQRMPIKEEFRTARKWMDYFSRSFANVLVLEGNHEARERKHFASRLSLDEREWLLSKSILERVTEDMSNVEIVKRVIYETPVMWLTQVGKDALVGHPEKHSVIPGRAAVLFKQWADNWHSALGFDRPRLVIMGHTHQSSMNWVGDSMTIESGCLCRIQGYTLEPRMYSMPQRLGFVTFEQDGGITDMASVRIHFPFANNRKN